MRAIKLSGGNVVHCTSFHPPISCPCSTNHIKPPFISTPFLPLSPPFLTITPTHALSSQCRAVSNWVVVIFHLTHITAATTTSTASSSTSTKSPNTIPTLFLFYLFQFLISSFGGSSKHVGRAWIHRACAGKRRKTRFLLVQLSNRGWCECVHQCADHVRRVQVYRETCASVLTTTLLYCCIKWDQKFDLFLWAIGNWNA